MTTGIAWISVAFCLALTAAAPFYLRDPPLAVSLLLGAVLRIGFAGLTSEALTPHDTRSYFRQTGRLIEAGRDPLHDLPGRQWNFLELMPYVHAVELHLGLPWVFAVKIVPIAADVVLIWLVHEVAGADRRLRAFQYAVNPLSLLIVSLHGQVEPVALALCLGGLLILRRDRPVLAGLLFGAAVAAKTWPIIVLVAAMSIRSLSRTGRLLLGSVVVPFMCLASGVLFLDTHPAKDLVKLATYSSYVDVWTWSGLLAEAGTSGVVGYESSVRSIASGLIFMAVLGALLLMRHHNVVRRVLVVLAAVLITTAGFGTQYLLWILPLSMAISGPRRLLYLVAATFWAGVAYLGPIGNETVTDSYLRGLSWLPAAALVWLAAEMLAGRSWGPQQ